MAPKVPRKEEAVQVMDLLQPDEMLLKLVYPFHYF